MVYINIVADYTILMFLYLSYILCINHIAHQHLSLPDYNFGRVRDSLNSKQEILHEHYIPAKYTYYTYLYYLPC